MTYYIQIERLFGTDQFLLKVLGVYYYCFQVKGFRIKIMTSYYTIRQI